MKDNKRGWLALTVAVLLLGTPVLSLAKARSGYRGGPGSSRSSSPSDNSFGSGGSRTFESNGFKPIERPAASPGSAAGLGVPATPAAPPVAQPSFFQRNPIMTGIGAGVAGSWIGHILFGATSAPAVEHDGSGNSAKQENNTDSTSSGPLSGLVLFTMGLVGFGAYYLYKRRHGSLSPGMIGSGNTRSSPRETPPVWVPASVGILSPSVSKPKLMVDDEAEFHRLLVEIQIAWSRQDVQVLRRATTPEMCRYFSDKLAENVSAGVENRIEDVSMVRMEVCESWVEDARLYTTVLMQWTARDYVVPLAEASDLSEAGNSSDRSLREFAEAWTFVKYRDGTWQLSAIQQAG